MRRLQGCVKSAWMLAICLWSGATAVSAASSPVSQTIDPAANTRILCLGDSITAGYSYPGAYRPALAAQLQSAGYKFTFVGTRVDYNPASPVYPHDGWPGYQMLNIPNNSGNKDTDTWTCVPRDDKGDPTPDPKLLNQIYGSVIINAMATNPDVVLLMIGVNDMFYPDYLHASKRGDELREILKSILARKSTVKVIVAPITYRRGAVDAGQCDSVSAAQKSIAEEFKNSGSNVQYAPQAGGGINGPIIWSEYDLPDSVHPACAEVYARIGNGFFNAIVEGTVNSTRQAPVVALHADAIRGLSTATGSLNITAAVTGQNIKSILWSKVETGGKLSVARGPQEGTGSIEFSPSNAANTTVTFGAIGRYQLRLKVTDANGLFATKDVLVNVSAVK